MNDIIIQLRKFLMKEKDLLIKANEIDIKSGNDELDIYSLNDCFNFDIETRLYGVRLEGYADDDTRTYKIYDSYGVIGVDCKDNLIYPLAKVIAYCVYTNNSLLINIKKGKNYVTINMLATLVNRFLEVNNINIKIEIISENEESFFSRKDINKVFIIGNYDYYLKYKIFTRVETKAYIVDNPLIVVDDAAHVELLKGIDKNILVYTNQPLGLVNRELAYVNMDDIIQVINESKYRHKVIFLTNDDSKGKQFVNKCKCENVLVNVVDLSTRMPNFDQKDFLYIKSYVTVK